MKKLFNIYNLMKVILVKSVLRIILLIIKVLNAEIVLVFTFMNMNINCI